MDDNIFFGFIKELEKQLSSGTPRIDKEKWKDYCYRSNLLLGVKRKYKLARMDCILTNVFGALQYGYPDGKDLILYEMNRIDIIAATGSAEKWRQSALQAKYTYDIALEVENSLHEFQMTIRGLFDVRATKYISIFFTNESIEEDIEIPIYSMSSKSIRLSDWKPALILKDAGINFIPNINSLLIIFLSETSPKIVCAKSFPLPEGKVQVYP